MEHSPGELHSDSVERAEIRTSGAHLHVEIKLESGRVGNSRPRTERTTRNEITRGGDSLSRADVWG